MIRTSRLIRLLNGGYHTNPTSAISRVCQYMSIAPPSYAISVERKDAVTLFNRCECSINLQGTTLRGFAEQSRAAQAKVEAARDLLTRTAGMFLHLLQVEQQKWEQASYHPRDPVGELIQLSYRLHMPEPLYIIQRHTDPTVGFVCHVHTHIGKERVYSGTGSSKRKAKAVAALTAQVMLRRLLSSPKPKLHWGYK